VTLGEGDAGVRVHGRSGASAPPPLYGGAFSPSPWGAPPAPGPGAPWGQAAGGPGGPPQHAMPNPYMMPPGAGGFMEAPPQQRVAITPMAQQQAPQAKPKAVPAQVKLTTRHAPLRPPPHPITRTLRGSDPQDEGSVLRARGVARCEACDTAVPRRRSRLDGTCGPQLTVRAAHTSSSSPCLPQRPDRLHPTGLAQTLTLYRSRQHSRGVAS
jgi:hypothetical protein